METVDRLDLHEFEDDLVKLSTSVQRVRDTSISLRDAANADMKTPLRHVSAALDTAYACVNDAKRLVIDAYGGL